jgi:uncharacterized protein DUF1559
METTIGLFFLMSILAITASAIFMFLIFYPLGKLQRKIGLKKFILILFSLIAIICLFLPPSGALILLILLFILWVFSMTSKNRYIVFTLLTFYFWVILGMMLPPLGAAREPARRIACASNLKQFGTVLYMYANDNNGHFPDKNGDAGLDMLRKQNYLGDYAVYLCPSTTDIEPETGPIKSSYIYHGGLTVSSPPKTILLEDKENNHFKYSNYLYCEMSVTGDKDPNYHDYKKAPIIKSLIRLLFGH